MSTSLLTKQGPINNQFHKIGISALLLHSSGYLAFYIIYIVLDAKLPQTEPKSKDNSVQKDEPPRADRSNLTSGTEDG